MTYAIPAFIAGFVIGVLVAGRYLYTAGWRDGRTALRNQQTLAKLDALAKPDFSKRCDCGQAEHNV